MIKNSLYYSSLNHFVFNSEEVVKCLTDDSTYRAELEASELWTEPGNH